MEIGADDDRLIEVAKTAEDEPATNGRSDKKGKQGPRNYSTAEKLAALNEWEQLDKDKYPTKVEDWLE